MNHKELPTREIANNVDITTMAVTLVRVPRQQVVLRHLVTRECLPRLQPDACVRQGVEQDDGCEG